LTIFTENGINIPVLRRVNMLRSAGQVSTFDSERVKGELRNYETRETIMVLIISPGHDYAGGRSLSAVTSREQACIAMQKSIVWVTLYRNHTSVAVVVAVAPPEETG